MNNCLSMHILSIMGHKGRVGKIKTTLNIAVALHEEEQRVLLLDLDSPCSPFTGNEPVTPEYFAGSIDC